MWFWYFFDIHYKQIAYYTTNWYLLEKYRLNISITELFVYT